MPFLLDWDHANGVRKYKSPLPARGRRVAEPRRAHELANNGIERELYAPIIGAGFAWLIIN
jgi:hypothetical protein